MHDDYNFFMTQAVEMAKRAYELGEIPVGALIVRNGEVISQAYNSRETDRNALAHAELKAINEACKKLGGWRLIGCDLYVTLEPCPMCTGAMINSRIERIIYGADNPKFGSCGSIINLIDFPYNHKPQIISGIMADECSQLLKDFGKNLRNGNVNPIK